MLIATIILNFNCLFSLICHYFAAPFATFIKATGILFIIKILPLKGGSNMLLTIDWATVSVKALQFILSFSILVTLHEMGHFFTARWFKCRVEKFYLFFDPWFSLFKKKVGDTEYGVGWVPFGGYVKIAGMVDESMDKEQMKLPAQPWEFRSKPAWQRLIIMLGGVVVNIILAIFLFIMISWKWGDEYIPASNLSYGVSVDSLGRKIGMKDGDNIVAIAGTPYERVGTAAMELIQRQAKVITIKRDGKLIDLAIPAGFLGQLNKNHGGGFTYLRFPAIVDSVDLKSIIIKKGSIHKGDTLKSINGKQISWIPELIDVATIKDTTATLTFITQGNDSVTTEVYFNKEGISYINYAGAGKILGTKKTTYTFLESIPAGWNLCWKTLDRYIQNLKLLFAPNEIKLNDSLGSVISIGNAFSGNLSDWQGFWSMTAIFSIILAFMNVLPIPALDGGHALFCIYEMITRKKPGDKFMEYAQIVGMVLLLGLMAYALGLDIFRVVTDLFK